MQKLILEKVYRRSFRFADQGTGAWRANVQGYKPFRISSCVQRVVCELS